MSKIPESRLMLSLCMIVKNESQNLPRCLNSAKPYVNEIIVVDTGSQDSSPEIALKYGAIFKHFDWCDDFAAARNYAISNASGDWILMLDADEQLVVDSENFLDQIRTNSQTLSYALTYFEINDQSKRTPSYRVSLFRNIAEFKYVGRFHEYLTYQNQESNQSQTSLLKSVRILHYGFSQENLQQKNISRNIPMLERIREQEGLSLRLLACLAGMYADAQQLEKAQECSEEVFQQLVPNLIEGKKPEEFSFVPDMLYVLGSKSLLQKDYETAQLICQRGLEWCPNYPPLNYLAGVTLKALGFLIGAVAYFENCLQLGEEASYYKDEPFEFSYMTTYPAYDLGCIYIELEQPQEALAAFELAFSFDANFTAVKEKIDKIRQLLGN